MEEKKRKKVTRARLVVYTVILTVIGILGLTLIFDFLLFSPDDYYDSYYSYEDDDEDCNVTYINLFGYLSSYDFEFDDEHGTIISSSEYIANLILHIKRVGDEKGLLLIIDSYGGDVIPGEEIAEALKAIDIPTVALIKTAGVSSAYWAATGADKIFASQLSEVGGIGVTASYIDESEALIRDGYRLEELSSAKYKDAGHAVKKLTEEEREMILSQINTMHEIFVESVAENRGMSVDDVNILANGATYLGEEALEYGLIDEIGGVIEVNNYFKEVLGEDILLCAY